MSVNSDSGNEPSDYNNLFEELVNHIPVGIQIFDKNGLTVFINEAQLDFLVLKDASAAVGQFNVLTDPFSKSNGSAEFYKKVYKTKKEDFRKFEVNFNIQSNKWQTAFGKRYIKEHVTPILFSANEISFVFATIVDITEDEESNSEPFNREQRFRSIFENAVAGIAFTDSNGGIILANKSFENITGYGSNEIIGKRFSDITYHDDLEKESELVRCAIESKTDTCRLEKRYVRKDKTVVWVDVSIAVIRDKNDVPINFVGVVKDINLKKQAESELADTHEFNKTIIDTSPVGIVTVDVSGQIIFANRRAENLLGLSKENIRQRAYNAPDWKITDFNGLPFPEQELPFIRVMKEMRPVHNVQHAIELTNGEKIFLSINASPQIGPDSEFSGMIATIENITSKVKADIKIKENNNFLNAIISNAAEGLCVCHNCENYPFVNFTVWNDEMTSITGYTMQEINNLGWYQTLYPDPEVRERAMNRMTNMRLGDNITGEEWLITRKGNKQRLVSIASSIISVQGDEVHVMALINDITEKQKTKTELERVNKNLKELNDSKDRFLAILAHDLKGPLGASFSLSELLHEKIKNGDFENAIEHMNQIRNSVKRSFDLLNDLLEWSIAQTNKADFNPIEINLENIIDKTIEALAVVSTGKSIRIYKEITNETSVIADEDMIFTIIRNLISNAIKYSLEGGEIKIKVVGREKEMLVSVIDEGVGIEKTRLEKLFRIDENISTPGTSNEKGTGLGLLLCKELVEYHNGKIWVESEVRKGAIFNFSIPKEKRGVESTPL